MVKKFLYFLVLSIILSCSKDDLTEDKPEVPSVTPPSQVALELVKKDYKVTNLQTQDEGQIILKFNKPVSWSSFWVDGEAYFPATTNGDSTLVVKLPMEFDNTYDCRVEVVDVKTKEKKRFVFSLNTFVGRYEYDGTLVTVLSDDKSETMWMATVDYSTEGNTTPYRISRISMEDPSKPAAFRDFKQAPNVMALNPYNNKLYVGTLISTWDDAQTYDYKIHILDPNTLKEEDSFVISHKSSEPGDGNGFPDASPRSMAFTDDGFGLVVLQEYGSSGTAICYVDCADGHKLIYDWDCWTEYYSGVTTSYDKKSLIINCDRYMGPDIYTLSRTKPYPKLYDATSCWHSSEVSGPAGTMMNWLFHRTKPLYYALNLNSRCRFDYSKDSYSPTIIPDRGDYNMSEIDYLNDDYIVAIDGFEHVLRYKDMTTDNIVYACRWFGVGDMSSNYPIFHNASRDILITFYGPNYTSCITTYNMDHFRHK